MLRSKFVVVVRASFPFAIIRPCMRKLEVMKCLIALMKSATMLFESYQWLVD